MAASGMSVQSRAALDLGPHGARGVHEADVALYGVEAHTFDAQRRAPVGCNRARGDEVGRGRRITFHPHLARRRIVTAGGDGEALPVLVPDVDAEALQQAQRDLDIGLRDQFAFHLDHQVVFGRHQRQRQQQGGQELAGDVTTDLQSPTQCQLSAGFAHHTQRRETGPAQVFDAATQGAQGVDQIGDGALVHARNAAQLEAAALGGRQQGQRGCQRAHGGAGVAQKQLRLVHLQSAAQARHLQHPLGALALFVQRATQAAQRVQHHAGVVAVQQRMHGGRALGQPGQQQHAVRDAL
jgi:hypothetical protein